MEGIIMLDFRIKQEDLGYLRLLIDLASIESKDNKKKIKNSSVN
jgi:hypothetical protein